MTDWSDIYTETEKQLAGVTKDDGPYVTRLKVMSWRGETDFDYSTGLPNWRKRQPAKAAAPNRAQPTTPAQPMGLPEALGLAIFWIGLIWLLSWLLG